MNRDAAAVLNFCALWQELKRVAADMSFVKLCVFIVACCVSFRLYGLNAQNFLVSITVEVKMV